MSNRLVIALAMLSLSIINVSEIFAGEKLSNKEVVNLLSGNTVKGYFAKESGRLAGLMVTVRMTIKYFDDGSAEKTTYPPKAGKGAFKEKGTWFVNKKGKLCMTWKPENKKECGRLQRALNGKYEFYRKKQKIIFDEIVPGA